MESEEEIRQRLKRLHGQEISKEMGGQVAKAKARQLIQILELDEAFMNITGTFEHAESNVLTGTYKGVDVSDFIEVEE